MTIQELYAKIGGNYEQAQKIMKMDKLIDRYVRKLAASGTYEKLAEAGKTLDAGPLFEAAHAMKGVCANLGLDTLSRAAGEITEEFRPGSPRKMTDAEVREKLAVLAEMYQRTVKGIEEYVAGA
ncbi:MAG: Hpt domain-containing protein [Clostridia bacterium]|nr:Hpt domain-containing protein [Clostridia bacterium]